MSIFEFLGGIRFTVDSVEVNNSSTGDIETFAGTDCLNNCINKYGSHLVTEWRVSDGPGDITVIELTV